MVLGVLSIGAPRELTFIQPNKKNAQFYKKYPNSPKFSEPIFLSHGDIYVTKNDTQYMSEHGMFSQPSIYGPRISLTGRVRKYHETYCAAGPPFGCVKT